jgi:hypothetical protein
VNRDRTLRGQRRRVQQLAPASTQRNNALYIAAVGALPYALPPDKVASPLGQRPYDLRPTCITNWLNAGGPIAEVARRAGDSLEALR